MFGKKEPDNAARSIGNCIILTGIAGIILTAVYLICQNTLIAWFGGTVNEKTFTYAKEYLFWISFGIPFYRFG